MKYLISFLLILVLIMPANAKRLYQEKVYQSEWCNHYEGITEYVLSDGSRVDCLTETHAIEFDFASKWAEAIGQSLYYALQTNKSAGIVLIQEKESDYKHWIKLNTVVRENDLDINLWLLKSY